jgi:hypothetical protein
MARRPLTHRLDPPRFPVSPPRKRANIEDLLWAVERYHLRDHDPVIAHLSDALQRAGPALHDQLATTLQARVQPFLAYHRDHPFPAAPRSVLTGPITLGTQAANQAEIGLSLADVNLHGMIVGPSGSGKTTVLRHLAAGLLNEGIRLAVIDTKEDFGWLLQREDVLLIDETTPWNFLATPAFLTPAAHRDEVIDLLLARFYGGAAQRAILEETWDHDAPASLADWVVRIEQHASPKERAGRADARQGAIARLRRFAHHHAFTTRTGISWETLLKHTFLVRSRGFDDVARFQFDLLARYSFLANRARHHTTLDRVLLIDESYDLMSEHQDGIRSIDPLQRLKQLGREFGIGTITTTVTLNGLSDLARASTHWHIALPPNNHEEARAIMRVLGLDDEQATSFLRLRRGEALLRIGTWPAVVHLLIPPHTTIKHATDDDITAARERTNRHAPTPQPAPPVPTAHVATTPAQVALPLPPVLALNTREEAFLRYACERGVILVTEAYDHLSLRPTQGDRVKTNLLALGLLTQEPPIRCRSGRGSTATPLRPTPTAYARLHLTPPKLGRGGGPQHQYLLRELQDHLGARVEIHGADAVLSYNAKQHEHLITTLDPITTRIAPNTGDVLAIEVELTTKHIAANLARNTKHGFAATIILTLPRDLEQTKRCVQHLKPAHPVLIGDALHFLDQIRKTP